MEDILMVCVVVPFLIIGYYFVKRIDLFRKENRK